MNARQLKKLGVPEECVSQFIIAVQSAAGAHRQVKSIIPNVVADPRDFLDDPDFATAAKVLIDEREYIRPEPISYVTWGNDIDEGSHDQMKQACSLPMAIGGALMPDAHLGYGLPIGGVLALENAVCPFAVGVDIACRMKMSLFDTKGVGGPPGVLDKKLNLFSEALEKGTNFGVGKEWKPRKEHAVMDDPDWEATSVTRANKDKAWAQLGTSGSGNHFAEFGVLKILKSLTCPAPYFPIEKQNYVQDYVALMSHSGSRGTGATVCKHYSGIAQSRLPRRYKDLGRLAWLDMDSEAGQEYWIAMNLMGRYAAANHEIIHKAVAKHVGDHIIGGIENHHNFAWKEAHFGVDTIVHRKGATPAGLGVLGVIPGSMGTPAYVVEGCGYPPSLMSASHGAGRRMSRRRAKETYNWKAVQKDLEKKGIHVLSAAADEVPYAYKDIDSVMAEQKELVHPVAVFHPKIVKMCGDGSKAED